ncbi:MAG TPA: GNAT family N-acetyltransferase [Pseudonocardia sp.]|jgi:RimJ/RimL family protein N-acetyltransferase|nr:GNAT family N-acetyltransferase [Pseudonocardia sp.]
MLRTRQRRDADLAAVVGWITDREALELFTGTTLCWPLTEEQLRELLAATAGMTAWTLVDDVEPDRPLGHFDLTRDSEGAHLGRVIIAPERRGEGLGRQLLGLVLDNARKQHLTLISLNVAADNLPAIRTYQHWGFVADEMQLRDEVIAMTYVE